MPNIPMKLHWVQTLDFHEKPRIVDFSNVFFIVVKTIEKSSFGWILLRYSNECKILLSGPFPIIFYVSESSWSIFFIFLTFVLCWRGSLRQPLRYSWAKSRIFMCVELCVWWLLLHNRVRWTILLSFARIWDVRLWFFVSKPPNRTITTMCKFSKHRKHRIIRHVKGYVVDCLISSCINSIAKPNLMFGCCLNN